MGQYDTAQVCLNGHLITDSADFVPQLRQPFCKECGQPTTMSCAHCGALIRGNYWVPGFITSRSTFTLPAYCHNCGKPYPWTSARIAAAQELARELDELGEDEQEQLADSIQDLVTDNPRTNLAISRYKRALAKVGPQAAGALRDILIDIVSETVKKALWP